MRNTLKYVSYKDKKEFASDLKSIYLVATETQAMENLDKVTEKWEENFRKNEIAQPIRQLNMPIYKITEEKQENKEIKGYNVKEFSVNMLRKKSSNLGFEISYGNNGAGYGSHYFDEETGISILIITNSFLSGEYSKKLKIENKINSILKLILFEEIAKEYVIN